MYQEAGREELDWKGSRAGARTLGLTPCSLTDTDSGKRPGQLKNENKKTKQASKQQKGDLNSALSQRLEISVKLYLFQPTRVLF